MSDLIRVNDDAQCWGSIILKLDSDRFYGFTGLSYGDKRERVYGYGLGRSHAPSRRSSGKYTPDNVKLTGWKDAVETFRIALAARSLDGRSYGNVKFKIDAQFIERGSRPMSVLIEDCCIVADASSHEENPDPLKEEIEINPMRIWRNGKTLFDSSQGG